jgi:hypothetical protein
VNFIKRELARNLKIESETKGRMFITGYNGQKVSMPKEIRNLQIRIDQTKEFVVVEQLDEDMIMGLPWLRRNNPRIDWSSGDVKLS